MVSISLFNFQKTVAFYIIITKTFTKSLVLLAVCDAKYTFTLIDNGSYGSNNDCGILAKSVIGKRFDDN